VGIAVYASMDLPIFDINAYTVKLAVHALTAVGIFMNHK
jgi:hypothetical protein